MLRKPEGIGQRERAPFSLRRRFLIQIIFLVLVLGLMSVFLKSLERRGGAPADVDMALPRDAAGAGTVASGSTEDGERESGESAEESLDLSGSIFEGEDLTSVGVAAPVEPAPFEERPEMLGLAASAESKREVDPNVIEYFVHRTRARPEDSRSEPALSSVRGDAAWRALREHPDLHRGELIEFRGNAVQPTGRPIVELESEIPLPNPAPSGATAFWRLYVLGEEQKLYLVILGERPTVPLEHMDGVRIRGRFVQLYHYEAEVAGRTVPAVIPLVVGSSLDKIPTPSSGHSVSLAPLYGIVLGGALIAGAVVLIVSWRSDRAYARRRAEKKGRR